MPSFFFKEAGIGVNLVGVCTRLIYCFNITDNTSIQLPSPFSKTGRLRRSLIVQLNLSAKDLLGIYNDYIF